MCLTIDTGLANPPLKEDGYVSGVDLGEINIAAVVTETGQGLIINGRALRSIKRLRNKRHAVLASRLSRCKPNSKRFTKLRRSKCKASAKFYAQQRDLLHKASRQVVNFCQVNHVKEIAVGDVRSIQNRVNLRKNANQKISQWAHGQFVHYLVYKARQYGIRVKQIAEDYSTRTCSICGFVRGNAPQGRIYTCPRCSTAIHRDLNGASNICSRARYGKYSLIKVHNIKYLRPL
jgi:putative transposase